MSTPYAPVFTDLGILYMVSPTAYQALGKDGFGLAPVGTGEFKFESLVPDDLLTLVKNEDYAWAPDFAGNEGAPPADGLTVKYLADEAVIYASLETGELNIIGVPPQYLPQAEANPDIEIQEGIEWTVWYLGFNLTKAPFDDMNVRQAIAYAIDRDEIILAGFDGKGYPLFGPLSPSITGFSQEVEDYGAERSNDIEKALQFLADAGYADSDGDGIVEKDGAPLSIHLDFPNAAGIQRVAETIQAQLADIGIDMTISQVEAAAIADMSNRCEHDAFIRAYGLADATILASLTSPRVGAGNRICLSNEEFDALNKAADTTVGDARQAAIDAEAKWLVDYRGHIPMMAPISVSGYRTEVHDLQWDITGASSYFNTWVGN
jgi:peptide/nickel transport system substrate-binding protein